MEHDAFDLAPALDWNVLRHVDGWTDGIIDD